MICINCSNETNVVNSRPHKKTPSVWRRRQCKACGLTFTTHEVIADDAYTFKVLSNRKKYDFSLPRLMMSISLSLSHRESQTIGDDAYWLAQTVAQNIQASATDIINDTDLALAVHEVVSQFDATAGIQYGARHGLVHNIAQKPKRGRPRTGRRTL